MKLANDSEEKITYLKRALDLYKGQFLVEFYSEWTEGLRRQLEDKYLKTMITLADIMEHQREFTIATSLIERLLDIDPYHEEAYSRLIKWQLAQGDRSAAEKTYRQYSNMMATEMGRSKRDFFNNLPRSTT